MSIVASRAAEPDGKPAKLRRGFKGPKIPRQEDRITGFGKDEKAAKSMDWLGIAPADDKDTSSQGTGLASKAQERVQEELTALQRALNNAAKEDNAMGVSQCMRMQDGLDLQLLGPAGHLDLGTALCLTARRGNLLALAALLEHGANTEFESDDHRMRPLHFAVANDKPMAARALIEARANLHAPSDSGVPLVVAVNKMACASVWELLRVDRCDKENTDPDHPSVPVGKMLPPSDAQVAAFHVAVFRGDVPIVRQFIKAGIQIDVPNHNGWSAVHIACNNNYTALVKLLAGSACKLNTTEPETGMTPLVIAAKQGYVGIVTMLLDIGVELDYQDDKGVTALQSACGQGRYDILSLLLEQGASCTKRTMAGDTALTLAIKANFQDVVSRLLRHPGLDPENINQFAPTGPGAVMWSPMQVAAREGHMSVCEVLWKQGKTDVNRQLRDEAGLTWTTLSIAASRNHLDVCKLLLKGRVRVYPTNEDGRQAVWFAARDGFSAVTMALLEGGGNANQADVDGLTPALAAALYGHASTVMRILHWQVGERRELEEAHNRQKLEEDAAEEVNVYADEGSGSDDSFDAALQQEKIKKRADNALDVMTVSADDLLPGALGPSPTAGLGLVLRTAVLREDLDLVELALRLGADPESEDDQHRKCSGQWAVEQAVAHGRVDVLLRVARTGACLFHRMPRRPSEWDSREMQPYHYALHSRIRRGDDPTPADEPFVNGRPGGLAAGIDIRPGLAQELDSIVDPFGRSPLIYAVEQENFRWVEDLLAAGADIQVLDSDGWNVIHCAAFRSYLEMLVLLLPLADAAGIDLNARAIDGRTALDLAKNPRNGRDHPDPAVAEELVKHGATVSIITVRSAIATGHDLTKKKKTEMELEEKVKQGKLAGVLPLAAVHSAIAIVGLLWTSISVYEVPWQLGHVSRTVLTRSTFAMGAVLVYALLIPVLVQSAPNIQSAVLLSQLGVGPILMLLIGLQLLVVQRAMYADPAAKGCRSMPAMQDSWKAKREIYALCLEGMQHLSVSFASEVSWNPDSGIAAFAQLFSLTMRRRWFGAPPYPAVIAGVLAGMLAVAWLALAGYMSLTLRVMFDTDLRAKLPHIRADRGLREHRRGAAGAWETADRFSEGPAVLLLGTSAYLAVMAGLLRQLHCAPTPAPIAELGGGDRNADAPRETLMPRLWDDAEGLVPPTLETECWTSSSHAMRAELAIIALILYQLTSSVLAPFFAQSREPTVRLSEVLGEPLYTAQPGIRRSYKFDAIARLVKLIFAVVAVFGRGEASLTLPVALCGNGLLCSLAGSAWCRPTNHALLNTLWQGVYGAAAWMAVVAWTSYVVAAPETWGTVGLLLVGWVAGGLKLYSGYATKDVARNLELHVERDSDPDPKETDQLIEASSV